MKTRILEIQNFKNVICKEIETENEIKKMPQSLLLDAIIDSNDKETRFGGLVIIIGENNTGKSNISKALCKFIEKNVSNIFEAGDYPNFVDSTHEEPILSIKVKKTIFNVNSSFEEKNEPANKNEIEYRHTIISQGRKVSKKYSSSKQNNDTQNNEHYQEKLEAMQEEKNNEMKKLKYSNYEIYNELKDKYKAPIDSKSSESFKSKFNEQIDSIKQAKEKVQQAKTYEDTRQAYLELEKVIDNAVKFYNESPYIEKPIHIKTQFIIPKKFINLVGISNSQAQDKNHKQNIQIIKYDNSKAIFKTKDLTAKINELESSNFFKALSKAANIDLQKDIIQPFNHYNGKQDYLPRIEKIVNDKLQNTITKEFNKLYKKQGDMTYEFEVNIHADEITFSISRNDGLDVLELDFQSEGFKWFFNLFFGLLYNQGALSPNSIVLMDEPAHNLSVPARKGCRDFLKHYGEQHAITFVVVTHDPFLVDIDNLDELRIITNMHASSTIAEGKGVNISNDFSVIEREDSNALSEIKKAFGVSSHFFYNPGMRIVFVEGITDYNYLTTFKILKKQEGGECNIAFLPIGGLGKSDDDKAKVIENIINMVPEPILLVDSDMAGRKFKEIRNGKNKYGKKMHKLTIVELKEIDTSLREIEDCFSDADFKTYNLAQRVDGEHATPEEQRKNPVKNSQKSKALKREIISRKGKISPEAKQRFYKILEFLDKDL